MSNIDPDHRKDQRRNHLKKKHLDKPYENADYKDQNKLKKQFKRTKEQMRQEELWEEWNDEIH